MYDEQFGESREKSEGKKPPHEGIYKMKNVLACFYLSR